jgi:hypothetical protein
MGGGTIVPRSLKTKRNEKIVQARRNFFSFLKIINDPFLFTKNSFSKIQSINCDRDDCMSRSWAKMSKFIPLSLRPSGIEFDLV